MRSLQRRSLRMPKRTSVTKKKDTQIMLWSRLGPQFVENHQRQHTVSEWVALQSSILERNEEYFEGIYIPAHDSKGCLRLHENALEHYEADKNYFTLGWGHAGTRRFLGGSQRKSQRSKANNYRQSRPLRVHAAMGYIFAIHGVYRGLSSWSGIVPPVG